MDELKEFTLRSFLKSVEGEDPKALVRISRPIEQDYDSTALVMELEKLGRSPVLWFDKVASSPFPVVTNVFGSRSRYALALGVAPEKLIETWASKNDQMIEPALRDTGPVHDVVLTGDDVDLGLLPIMAHFAEDAGRYITNAIVVANDPDTGVRNASFHRMQVKGSSRLGTSLHSRRHLWNYAQRAEERGEDLPIAIVVGAHPLFTFGGLWKGPIGVDEYAVIGGLMGRPLDIVKGRTVPIDVPAEAEFVLEGRILAICHRRDAIYQDIVPGISEEHTSLLAVPAEARLLKTLRQHFPNATAVSYPKSGTCRFHAYIALRRATAGQAR